MKNDPLGDRIKAWEKAQDGSLADSEYIVARIDGRCFSKFTKGFEKPFDATLTKAMVSTTEALVTDMCATLGYTQSDEITLVFARKPDSPNFQHMFNGRVFKLCSVLASFATASFSRALIDQDAAMATLVYKKLPHFDCRVWGVDTLDDAVSCVNWRIRDAEKNSVSSFARCHLSHKEMQGLSRQQLISKTAGRGKIFYREVSQADERGRIVYKETVELTEQEKQHIPEKWRTNDPIQRSRTVVMPAGTSEDLRKILNGEYGGTQKAA